MAMAETLFDTHRFVKRLTEAGLDEPVAEALAEEQVRLLNGHLVTSGDLAATELALKTDLDRVKAELEAGLDRVKAELTADIDRVKAELTADIERVKAELTKDIERVKAELTKDIEVAKAQLKAELIRWIYGAMIAQVALIVALLKLFP